MKKQFLALLFISAMNSIAIADDADTYLKGLQAEVNSASKAQAVASLRKAAEKGDAKAQLKLGTAYATGEGIVKDDAQAVAWFRKAAKQGDAKAQVNLGNMVAEGQGVAKDETEAVK